MLLVLPFDVASTQLVGNFTLLRWIAYTVQMRKYRPQNDKWCFTNIEEKTVTEQEAIEMEESPGPTQHYEYYISQPLKPQQRLLIQTVSI